MNYDLKSPSRFFSKERKHHYVCLQVKKGNCLTDSLNKKILFKVKHYLEKVKQTKNLFFGSWTVCVKLKEDTHCL